MHAGKSHEPRTWEADSESDQSHARSHKQQQSTVSHGIGFEMRVTSSLDRVTLVVEYHTLSSGGIVMENELPSFRVCPLQMLADAR